MRRFRALAWLALPAIFAGCSVKRDTKVGVERANVVAAEKRKIMLIQDYSSPAEAQAAMGREPDAIQHDGGDEIHYYIIRGAEEGEALRLVYREGRLIGRSAVKTRPRD
ncbi:MAG: hypothetical protein M5U26_29275 [Planctomycetota bacterium]|nr:hypothetical protein [Planctomycetota bacterium]